MARYVGWLASWSTTLLLTSGSSSVRCRLSFHIFVARSLRLLAGYLEEEEEDGVEEGEDGVSFSSSGIRSSNQSPC